MNKNEKFSAKKSEQTSPETNAYELDINSTAEIDPEENEHTMIQPVLQNVDRVPKNFQELVKKQDEEKARIHSLRQELQGDNAVTRKLRGHSGTGEMSKKGVLSPPDQTRNFEKAVDAVATTQRIPLTRQEQALNTLLAAAEGGDREKMQKAVEIAGRAGFHIESRLQKNPELLKNYALFQKQYQPASIEREFQRIVGRASPDQVKNIVKRLYADNVDKRMVNQKTAQYTKYLNKLNPLELLRESKNPEAKKLLSATKLAPMTLGGLNRSQKKEGFWGKVKGFFGF